MTNRRKRIDKIGRASLAAAAIVALDPARAGALVRDQEGHRGLELALLHHRPERQLPWRPGRHQERDPRHDRDGRPSPPRSPSRRAWAWRSTSRSTARTPCFARTVRYFVDVMTGVPSIVFGLFIYIVLILSGAGGTGYAGWKGSVALALLMLPVVIALRRGGAAARPRLAPRGGTRARRAALARGLPDRASHRAARPGHRHAARNRPRGRRNGAAALHRRGRQRHDARPRQQDELPAGPDLQRRRAGAEPAGGPRLGSRSDARDSSSSS